MIDAAILTTDRLILRAPVQDDWPAFRDFFCSEDARFVGGPADLKLAYRLFTSMAGQWSLFNYSWFWAARRDTGAVVSVLGPHFPPDQDDLEIGWWTYPDAQNQGFAFEAVMAARDWTRAHVPAPRIVSYIDPTNAPSQALARKLGATTDGTRAAHDVGCEVWVHPEAPA